MSRKFYISYVSAEDEGPGFGSAYGYTDIADGELVSGATIDRWCNTISDLVGGHRIVILWFKEVAYEDIQS